MEWGLEKYFCFLIIASFFVACILCARVSVYECDWHMSDEIYGLTAVLALLTKPRAVVVYRLDLLAIKVGDRMAQWVSSRVGAIQGDSFKELSVHLESKKKILQLMSAHSYQK